jgi:hypothetical protein
VKFKRKRLEMMVKLLRNKEEVKIRKHLKTIIPKVIWQKRLQIWK